MIDLNRILDGGPWTFDYHPFLVYKLKLGENPLAVPLNKILCVLIRSGGPVHGAGWPSVMEFYW